jgi:Dolichyl-phosphate-mannose-protein mannosyltransferase
MGWFRFYIKIKMAQKKPRPKPVKHVNQKRPLYKDSRFWLVVIILVEVLIRLQLLGLPFDRDEGAYALYGRMILQGASPYVDFHVMKYPGLFYSYALLSGLSGDTMAGLQFIFILVHVASTLLVYSIAKQIMHQTAALISTATFSILSLNPYMHGLTIQSEHLLILYFLISTWFIVRGLMRNNAWYFLLAGIFIYLSFQIKQTAALLALMNGLILIGYYFREKPVKWKSILIHGGSYFAGFVLLLGLTIAGMKMMGVDDAFQFWTTEYPRNYLTSIGGDDIMFNLKLDLIPISSSLWPVLILTFAGLLAILVYAQNRWLKAMVLISLILSLATIVPGYRFFAHYYLIAVPVIAFITGLGLNELKKKKMGEWVVPVFVLSFVLVLVINGTFYFVPDFRQVILKLYGNNPFTEVDVIGDYINQNIQPGETIAVFGSEPELYYQTGVKPPSSFSYFEHIVKDNDSSRAWQKRFLADVEVASPRYIIYLIHPTSWGGEAGAGLPIADWGNIYFRNYHRIGLVDILPDKSYYFWGEDAIKRKPVSNAYIYFLERNKP